MAKPQAVSWTVVLIALIAASVATPAHAQLKGMTVTDHRFADTPLITDRLVLDLGGYLTEFSSEAFAGTGGGIGSGINLEEALGLEDESDVFRFDGLYKFNAKNAIVFGYYGFNRNAAGELEEYIDFLDLTFVGNYFATNDVKVYTVGYRRSLVNTGRVDAGLSIGLSTFDFRIAIEGEISVTGGIPTPLPEFERRAAANDVLAPVPTVGMFINYALTPRLILSLSAGFLDLDIDKYDGRFLETRVTIDWFFSRHWGVGAGLGSTDVRVINTGDNPYRFEYQYDGILLFLSASY
jgi:hypothetical protein